MERVLIISDVHANYPALAAVWQRAEIYEPTHIWFLGDAIGYGPHPDQTVEMLIRLMGLPGDNPRHVWLAGNHDWAMIKRGIGESFHGISPRHNKIRGDFSDYAEDVVDRHFTLLKTWVPGFITRLEAMKVACAAPLVGVYLAHGCYTSSDNLATQIKMLWEYPKTTAIVEDVVYKPNHPAWIAAYDGGPLLSCAGHWHVRALWRRRLEAPSGENNRPASWEELPWTTGWIPLEKGYFYHLNPGSVGFPANFDGKPSFAILEWDGGPCRIKQELIPASEYDAEVVRRDLIEANYPPRIYKDKLLKCTD